jgi:peptidoglycan hydrolase CwlO-like protein
MGTENNYTIVLQAIDKINDKLDAIRSDISNIQTEVGERLAYLDSWKNYRETVITSLELKITQMADKIVELEKKIAESHLKERIFTWGIGLILSGAVSWLVTHIK